MRKGFTLIELMTVLGIIVVFATLITLYLGGFAKERALISSTQSITAFIRDAQQRSINQDESRYWGFRIENQINQDRYLIFSATNTALGGFTTTSVAFVKSALNLVEPSLNTSSTILFDKVSGRALLGGCPAATVSSTIKLVLLSGNTSTTIKIYCNGSIQ